MLKTSRNWALCLLDKHNADCLEKYIVCAVHIIPRKIVCVCVVWGVLVPRIFVWGSFFWLCTPVRFLPRPLPVLLPSLHTPLTHTPLTRTPLTHHLPTHHLPTHHLRTPHLPTPLTHTPLIPTHHLFTTPTTWRHRPSLCVVGVAVIAFETTKMLRSHEGGLHLCYALRRLAANIQEPYRTLSLQAIDNTIVWWQGKPAPRASALGHLGQ